MGGREMGKMGQALEDIFPAFSFPAISSNLLQRV
jgi:hypothetical protein